jgi:hypothetical protein
MSVSESRFDSTLDSTGVLRAIPEKRTLKTLVLAPDNRRLECWRRTDVRM